MFDPLMILLAAAAMGGAQDAVQAPQSSATPVDDNVVTAEQRTDMARSFVNRVSAPARGRGLGRWRKICPGIANLDRPVAQPIVDRIAQTAGDLGIEVEAQGCEANIIVVFAQDPGPLTSALVASNPRVYRHGGGGIDRGSAALDDFQDSDRPVRWWSLSVPIDSETGQRAVRIPGDRAGGPVDDVTAKALGCDPNDCVGAGAPIIVAKSASRLNSQIVDQLYRSIVIVDIDAVSGLSTTQLGDYLAMVSLSQVDPEAETGAFDTVLNLFENPSAVAGLTAWDRAYLTALYDSPSRRRSAGAQAGAVAAIMNQNAEAQRRE